jgi:hypothetical protein
MTTIPLQSLPLPADEIRRDRWGRYLVLPPGSDKPKGYTRVTTVAKTLDEGGGLAPWKASMAVCGTLMRPAIRAQWEALLAQYGDPWYAGTHVKKECRRLVEEAAAIGGANDRREIGTMMHTVTALHDLGREPGHLSAEVERDLAAYADGLAEAGITILPGLVEQTVVLDGIEVAGTFDRCAGVPDFHLPLIADLKCGADLSYSWQGIAVQLAAYANADAIYRQGISPDGSDDVRLPMPEVDKENGLIMWLDAGSGKLELFLVDLTAGWEAVQQSMWTRRWRKTKLSMPLSDGGWVKSPGGSVVPVGPNLVPALQASLDAVKADVLAKAGPPPEPEPELAPMVPAELVAVRGWLAERIALIGTVHEARADLGLSWPADMPTLNSSNDHTAEQLAVIERLVADVERRNKIVFPRPRPGHDDDPVGLVLRAFPHSTVITKDTPA